jgi:hypothetical protein
MTKHPAQGVPLLRQCPPGGRRGANGDTPDAGNGKDASSGEELEALLVLIKGNIN